MFEGLYLSRIMAKNPINGDNVTGMRIISDIIVWRPEGNNGDTKDELRTSSCNAINMSIMI